MRKTAFAVLGILTLLVACGKSEIPTDVTPVTGTSQPNVTTNTTAPSTPAEDPSAAPANPGVQISVDADGNTRVTNPTSSPFGVRICTFIFGPHPQTLIGDEAFVVPVGGDKTFPFPLNNAPDMCGDVKLQVDAGQNGKIICTNPSNGLGSIIAWATPTQDFGECECEPTEWKEISRSDPYKGDRIRCPRVEENDIVQRELCYECYEQKVDVVYSNGCAERKATIVLETPLREIVECPCDPEEWTVIETSEPQKGDQIECPVTDRDGCWECFSQYVVDIEENCEGQTRRVPRPIDPILWEPVECPPEGSCYYNNQGDDGKEECEALPGFVSWNENNHLCELVFDGVCRRDFHLNSGQSVEGCLKWTGGDQNCNGIPDGQED